MTAEEAPRWLVDLTPTLDMVQRQLRRGGDLLRRHRVPEDVINDFQGEVLLRCMTATTLKRVWNAVTKDGTNPEDWQQMWRELNDIASAPFAMGPEDLVTYRTIAYRGGTNIAMVSRTLNSVYRKIVTAVFEARFGEEWIAQHPVNELDKKQVEEVEVALCTVWDDMREEFLRLDSLRNDRT